MLATPKTMAVRKRIAWESFESFRIATKVTNRLIVIRSALAS